MAAVLKNAQQRPPMAGMKEERARDAAAAMREYEAEKLAVLAKTERLRTLRLAKETGTVLKKGMKRPAGEDHR